MDNWTDRWFTCWFFGCLDFLFGFFNGFWMLFGFGFSGFNGFNFLKKDSDGFLSGLDISFLLIQRCNIDEPGMSNFGVYTFSFDEWTKKGDKPKFSFIIL